MRYYGIKIYGAPSAFPTMQGTDPPGCQWCTLINGQNDPGALTVELQIEEAGYPNPSQSSFLVIKGIPFAQIKQAANLMGSAGGCAIEVWGGMSKGLPLATLEEPHRGMLCSGKIQKAWGNWIGTDMSLNMALIAANTTAAPPPPPDASSPDVKTVTPTTFGRGVGPVSASAATRYGPRSISAQPFSLVSDIGGALGGIIGSALQGTTGWAQIGNEIVSFFSSGGSIAKPLNLIHNMQPNMLLSDAIRQTLQTAFPKAKFNINISPALKLAYQDAGMYQSMPQYAEYIKQLSHSILGSADKYLGVHMSSHGPSINVWDGTNGGSGAAPSGQTGGGAGSTGTKGAEKTVTLGYADLIGQPTWLEPQTISVKVVMRADIHMGDKITLPPGLKTIEGAAVITNNPGNEAKQGDISFSGTFLVTSVRHIGDSRNPDGSAWCTVYEATDMSAKSGSADTAKTVSDSNAAQNPSDIKTVTPTTFGRGVGPVSTQRRVRRY